ncbi:hypothetical protein PsYK624_005980 [Phanerochaete sordida]|uniref:Uncharacterized protein n=1 Tax=Phanerochaete sordida TaxID=48140 RepID=A0A9P3L8B6_9APHY|nr:hypothetical protein PsYK624_005980 [Phanerochaete sordida]
MDDRSDILGGQLHVARPEPLFALSGPSFTGILFYGLILIAAAAGLYTYTPHYRQYQEQRHRRAMRRRHGIPDSDHRPFNVAYAAVKRDQRERNMVEKGKSKQGLRLPPVVLGVSASRQGSAMLGQATRQRQAPGALPQSSQSQVLEEVTLPARSSYTESRRTSGQTTTASESDLHIPGAPQEAGNEGLAPSGSKQTLYAPAFTRGGPSAAAGDKHARDEEAAESEDEQDAKKSRLDATDEDGQWEGDIDDDMDVDEAPPAPRKRGTKRLASLEEDEGFESSKAIGRDKRARKVGQDMKIMRGKKRDRAEAGSTIGVGESSAEDEDEDKHRSNRRRRLAHKKSLLNARGRKRVREPEMDEDESDSDSPSKHVARYKRGRRSPRLGDFLSDDGMVSNDPLCKGRHIGEEWETNGIKFKVGPNGQRLRQSLVKKSRSLFPMPKDSEHPDRQANIDVYVETWLSEEEYQAAKEHNELAWQSHSASNMELPEELGSPSKGKRLLWGSAAQKEAGRKTLALGKSVSANHALRVPASGSSNGLQRRISTIVTPTPPTAPESPKVKSSKSYSKWEKQDLEAAAMARLREKAKVEEAAAEKKIAATSSTAPMAFPSVPAAAKAAEVPAKTSTEPTKPASTFTFSKPAAPSGAPAAKASPSDLPSLSIPSSAPKPAEPAKTSTLTFPTTSTTAAEPVKAPAAAASSPFAFGNPGQPAPAAAAAPAPTAPMNLFPKPAAPAPATNSFGSAQPSTVPSSTANVFGNATQNKPTSSASHPFGAPASNQPSSQQAARSPFTFGAAADSSKKSEERVAESRSTESTQGSSLLARMGGFAAPAAPATSAASQPSTSFAFGKTAAPAVPAAAPAAPGAAGSSAPVKFNFGLSSKPANAAPSSEPAKPEAPKFAFGAPSGPGAFGNTSANGLSSALFGAVGAPKDVPATPQPKSAFGQTAFPSTPANQKPLFGASTTPAGTPSGNSMFGMKPTEPQTPANNTATPMSVSTTPAGTPAPGMLFGQNAASTTPAGQPPKFGSAFGATVSTTPAGAPPKSAFGFGNTAASGSGSSMFGNTSKLGGTAPSSAAGNNAAEGPKTSPAFGPTQPASTAAPTFSFGGGFGQKNTAAQPSTAPAGSSAPAPKANFTFGSTSTPGAGAAFSFGASAGGAASNTTAPAQAAPNAFAFGASSGTGTFAFGQKPPESGQK